MNIHYFRDKKKAEMLHNLLDAKNREEMLKKLTTLQNEISIAFNTKVLAITPIDEADLDLAAAFAKAMGETYVQNGSSVLLIDANLYDPKLADLLGLTPSEEEGKIETVNEKTGLILLKKETYPSNVYKGGFIQKLVQEGEGKYEHVIILVPSIEKHKEVALLKDILDSVLILTRRDVTKKRDIYEALEFCAYAQIPVSKTVIIK